LSFSAIGSRPPDYHKKYYGVVQPKGLDCCAADAITFHYIGHEEARAIFAATHGAADPNYIQGSIKTSYSHKGLALELLTEKIARKRVQPGGVCAGARG
jgi:hypothetical protein